MCLNWINVCVYLFLYREIYRNPSVLKSLVRRRSLLPGFKNDKPLKIVIHGWMGKNEKRFSAIMREGKYYNNDIIKN